MEGKVLAHVTDCQANHTSILILDIKAEEDSWHLFLARSSTQDQISKLCFSTWTESVLQLNLRRSERCWTAVTSTAVRWFVWNPLDQCITFLLRMSLAYIITCGNEKFHWTYWASGCTATMAHCSTLADGQLSDSFAMW